VWAVCSQVVGRHSVVQGRSHVCMLLYSGAHIVQQLALLMCISMCNVHASPQKTGHEAAQSLSQLAGCTGCAH
jgi:hypothetical protein